MTAVAASYSYSTCHSIGSPEGRNGSTASAQHHQQPQPIHIKQIHNLQAAMPSTSNTVAYEATTPVLLPNQPYYSLVTAPPATVNPHQQQQPLLLSVPTSNGNGNGTRTPILPSSRPIEPALVSTTERFGSSSIARVNPPVLPAQKTKPTGPVISVSPLYLRYHKNQYTF